MALNQPLILGLPRGGVVVAHEVAKAFAAPLGVFIARKVGAPGNAEFAIGAVAEGGVAVFDDDSVAALGLDEERLEAMAEREGAEVMRRIDTYRAGLELPPLEDREVVLVDDGLATGLTARAALVSLRRTTPRRLVFAVPVGAADSVRWLEELAEVVCLEVPRHLGAVGWHYGDFSQTSDDEVIDLLARH